MYYALLFNSISANEEEKSVMNYVRIWIELAAARAYTSFFFIRLNKQSKKKSNDQKKKYFVFLLF